MIELLRGAAAVGAVAWYATSLFVGARLLRLGLRTDNPPARWIGTYLFFAMGLGSVLYMVAMLRTVLTGTPMTPVDRGLIAIHFVVAVIANYGLLTFVQGVFRRESVAARWATRTMLVCMVVGAGAHGVVTGFDGNFATAWAGLYLAVPVVGNAWAALESLRYFGMMRRRIALGMAKPLIANRFLLYGVGAASASILLGVNLFEMQVVARLSPEATVGVRMVSLALMAVLGLVCAGAYLFAFFPPRWYARRFAATVREA